MSPTQNDSQAPKPFTVEQCREAVEAFAVQVHAFLRLLPRFPDWRASALACDSERLFCANIAQGMAADLVGDANPLEDAAAVLEGEEASGGLLGTVRRMRTESDAEKLATLRYVLRNLDEDEKEVNR